MSSDALATLDDIAATLANGGYTTARRTLAERPAVVAENPYALIGVVELPDFEQLDERIFDAQAAFTRLTALGPSARNWDLYLVAHVTAPAEPHERAAMEAVEADTRYTRKLLHSALRPADLDRALRPLLPLRRSDSIDLVDPLVPMRQELTEAGLAAELVDVALATFRDHGEVRVR